VLALSDGVFAIIMTLLVLDISVPKLVSGETLGTDFLRDVFNLVRGVNRELVWLNILFMLPVALVPAAAALLGAYSRDPFAIRLYGLLLVVIALMRLVLWYYLGTRPHLLIEHVPPRTFWTGALLSIALILIYLIALLFADIAPYLSLGIYAGVPVLYFIGITFVRRFAPKGTLEHDFT
jgi:uncharacterized membrane protein